jgi:hypothetical protein
VISSIYSFHLEHFIFFILSCFFISFLCFCVFCRWCGTPMYLAWWKGFKRITSRNQTWAFWKMKNDIFFNFSKWRSDNTCAFCHSYDSNEVKNVKNLSSYEEMATVLPRRTEHSTTQGTSEVARTTTHIKPKNLQNCLFRTEFFVDFVPICPYDFLGHQGMFYERIGLT